MRCNLDCFFFLECKQGGKPASVSLHIRTGDDLDYHPEWYETLPQVTEKSTCSRLACTLLGHLSRAVVSYRELS